MRDLITDLANLVDLCTLDYSLIGLILSTDPIIDGRRFRGDEFCELLYINSEFLLVNAS